MMGELDAAAFSPNKPAKSLGNRYCLPRAFTPVGAFHVKYDRAADLAREMADKILNGDRVDALLSGNFIFGDLIEAFAVETNAYIDDLTLSTLSFSEENVQSLRNLMVGGYLDQLNIVVSDYFWSHNRINAPAIYEALDMGDRFQLAVAGIHTKIALMRIRDRKIVIHGSANLRSSRSLEAITIETNPDLYDFHMGWHSIILQHYATIRKSLRAQALFDEITRGASDKGKWGEE